MTVVGIPTPFHSTIALDENPLPFTVRVNAGPPADAVAGLMLPSDRVGVDVVEVMLKITAFVEVLFALTATVAVPPDAIRFAATLAVNCVALTNVVGRAEPFHRTVEAPANPLPFTVSVNAGPPACAEDGFTLETNAGATAFRIAKTYRPATPPLFKLPVTRLSGDPSMNDPGISDPVSSTKLPGA